MAEPSGLIVVNEDASPHSKSYDERFYIKINGSDISIEPGYQIATEYLDNIRFIGSVPAGQGGQGAMQDLFTAEYLRGRYPVITTSSEPAGLDRILLRSNNNHFEAIREPAAVDECQQIYEMSNVVPNPGEKAAQPAIPGGCTFAYVLPVRIDNIITKD